MFKIEFSPENTLTVNLWPALIILLIACTISIIVRRKQIKEAIASFREGKTDQDFIQKCQQLKRVYWSKQTRNVHDTVCGMLSAVYLEQGNEAGFFQNLNELKSEIGEIDTAVYMLFMQYFTGKGYLEIGADYRQKKDQTEDIKEIVLKMIGDRPELQEGFAQKAQVFADRLTNETIKKAFSVFADLVNKGSKAQQ